MAEDHSEGPNGKIEPPTGAPFAPLGICARCHRPLTRPSTAGGCLHCIVDFVGLDDDAGSAPAAGSEEVRRYSHFEIALEADGSLAELGHGAMGTTYRAQDTVLQSPVALKVIGRNVADSPSVRARFLREARTAAKLRHPNVASVFHYGEQEGECFYVMELVEGETLEERVRRAGPLSVPSVLEIGTQVARALEAAESQGLVHRDLKPSNLMLVKQQSKGDDTSGETLVVKVIDFGLAKAVSADEQAAGENDTRHGFVGTPAYASPEQFARDRAETRVDTRSDIYSLGVTLWYLLCGRTPFHGQTLEEIHAKQVSRALPLDQLTARRVPAPVGALLSSMLAVDPGARPQSARELLEALQHCQGKQSTSLRGVRVSFGALVILLLVAGACAVVLLRQHAQQATITRPPLNLVDRSVSVLPFENRSPDPSVAFFTGGVQDAISLELTRIAQLKVVTLTASDARAYPPGKRDLAKIARELGVSHLVEGTVQREGDRMQVSVTMTDIHDRAAAWSKHYEGRLANVFAIQRDITREVTERLRATLSPGEKAAINEPPTTDPVAYDLYLQATQGPRQFNGAAALRKATEEKLALLNQAVARDPKFMLAYCVIAELNDEIAGDMGGATPEEKAVDHRTLAEVALQKARLLRPDDGPLHLAQAHHFLLGSVDYAAAQVEIDLARRTLPNNSDVEQIAGLIARNDGRWDEAVRCFERALALQPHETGILTPLSRAYRVMRRYPEAEATSAKLLALRTGPNALYDRLLRATIPLEEKADVAPLRAVLATVKPAEDLGYLVVYPLVLALCTHDADAVTRTLAQAPTGEPIRYQGLVFPKGWFEGVAARMRGDEGAARVAFASARKEIEPVLQADPTDGVTLSLLAVTDAGMGHGDDALREAQHVLEIVAQKRATGKAPRVGCLLAVAYAWLGQRDLAFSALDELISKPAGVILLDQPTYGDFLLNPVWDPLRDDPRFAGLLEKLAPKPAH